MTYFTDSVISAAPVLWLLPTVTGTGILLDLPQPALFLYTTYIYTESYNCHTHTTSFHTLICFYIAKISKVASKTH